MNPTIPTMNPTTLLDNILPFPTYRLPDITNDTKYLPIVQLIEGTRQALINNLVFRQPFLNVLHRLYDDPKTASKILRVQPVRATDQDLLRFFELRWPEVCLTPRAGRGLDVDPYEWGFTLTGPDNADDDRVYISVPLVDRMVCSCDLGFKFVFEYIYI
jgi:hypothetical protein